MYGGRDFWQVFHIVVVVKVSNCSSKDLELLNSFANVCILEKTSQTNLSNKPLIADSVFMKVEC